MTCGDLVLDEVDFRNETIGRLASFDPDCFTARKRTLDRFEFNILEKKWSKTTIARKKKTTC